MTLVKLSVFERETQELILLHVGLVTILADTLIMEILLPTVVVLWIRMSLVLAKTSAALRLLRTPDFTC